MNFNCTKCGICCQNIGHIKELKEYDLGNGICKYFDKTNNLCTIYENRPDICNIDLMYEKEYYKFFTKKEFYILNAKVCNSLQECFGIDLSYRVNLEKE